LSHRLGLCDYAGLTQGLALSPRPISPSAQSDSVGVPDCTSSKLNTQPTYSPCLRFVVHLAMSSAKLGAEWIATPFSWESFILCFLPVDPGATGPPLLKSVFLSRESPRPQRRRSALPAHSYQV